MDIQKEEPTTFPGDVSLSFCNVENSELEVKRLTFKQSSGCSLLEVCMTQNKELLQPTFVNEGKFF